MYDYREVTQEYLIKQREVLRSRPHMLKRAYLPYYAANLDKTRRRLKRNDNQDGSTLRLAELRAIVSIITTDSPLLNSIIGPYSPARPPIGQLVYMGLLSSHRPCQVLTALAEANRSKVIEASLIDGYHRDDLASEFYPCSGVIKGMFNDLDGQDRAIQRSDAVILDLLHFQHKLWRNGNPFKADFEHSLLRDICRILDQLAHSCTGLKEPVNCGVLLGTMGNTPYVSETLQRLELQVRVPVHREAHGVWWVQPVGIFHLPGA